MTRFQQRKAFTLIELLVVVAIIALLIAILLPSLARARERARLAVCATHMRAWAQGFYLYAGNFDDDLPLDGQSNNNTSAPGDLVGMWSDNSLWFNGIPALANNAAYNDLQTAQPGGPSPPPHTGLPTAGSNSLYVCPDATSVNGGSGDTVTNGYFQTWGMDNSGAPQVRDMLLCYGINSQLRAYNYETTLATYPGSPKTGDISKLSLLEPPSEFVLMAEKRVDPAELNGISTADLNGAKSTQTLTQLKVAPKRFAARHDHGGNIAFADAHVEWFSFKTVNAANNVSAQYPIQYNQPGLMLWANQGGY